MSITMADIDGFNRVIGAIRASDRIPEDLERKLLEAFDNIIAVAVPSGPDLMLPQFVAVWLPSLLNVEAKKHGS
jgi:hypothetical protein